MNAAVLSLVLFTFLVGMAGLLVLLWTITRNRTLWQKTGATVIFDAGEVGRVEEPAASAADVAVLAERTHSHGSTDDARSAEDIRARQAADVSSRTPVLAFLGSAIVWLVIGSLYGLVSSLKMTFPDWLTGTASFTFGRVRPMHLNAVIYGFASMGGIAIALWLMPRLVRTPLRGGKFATAGVVVWNIGMVAGLLALAFGWTDGVEWLEFPWQIDALFVIGGALAGVPLLLTLRAKKVAHLYVSAWYLGAAFCWFPILFFVGNFPGVHFGVEQATINWWFAHNVLGLWLTPMGLAIAYYFIPKVLGRPIFSYGLSLIGFWSLALFYSQVGAHHLIGGPVPTWLIAVSIVHSVMMSIPVLAVAINHHITMRGRFGALRHSPTLRFVVVGALMYTATSFEGSLESIRALNRITHFTHFTVGHAHMGLYGFVSMEIFGAVYFMLPRLIEREWPYPSLIRAHFWLALVGIIIYVGALSIGGVLQGLAMLDKAKPFLDSVRVTIPFLHARTFGGVLMTLGHCVFAYHTWAMATGRGPVRMFASDAATLAVERA
jgi:cytochrome c oxidase cbb3-type subunit I